MAAIIYILFLITSFIFAQPQYLVEGSIKGMIVDSLTDKPVGYATITLLQSDNNSFISGTVSNEDGFFILEEIKPGKYNIKIQLVGYETLFLDNQLIVPPNMKKNLDTIILNQKMLEMEGVVIEENKIFVEQEIDKKVYNVEEMGLATSGTADDVLENLPSVRVDNDGNITLRGNSSVNIMIDGRMTGNNNLDILDASLVEKVEVITIPSVKYDPDGMAGIINVITKRNEYVGKSGKISIGTGRWGTRTFSGNASYLKDNLNLFANYSRGDRINKRGVDRYRSVDSLQINLEELIKSSTNNIDKNNQNLKLGGEYYLNDLNTIVFDIKYTDYNKVQKTEDYVTESYYNPNEGGPGDGTGNPIEDLDNVFYKSDSKNKGYDSNSTFGFYKEFNNDIQKFSIELSKDHDSDKGWEINERDNINSYEDEESRASTFKIDYTHPLNNSVEGENNTIEIGIQDKINNHKTNFNFNNDYNLDFSYQRNIMSLYIDATYYINDIVSWKWGHRFEKTSRYFLSNIYSSSNLDSNIFTYFINQIADTSINETYTRLYPSLFFQFDYGRKGTVKLALSRRIERPGEWSLAPLPRNFSNQKQFMIGNPKLKPEDIYKLELSYSNRLSFGFLSAAIYYSQIKEKFDYDTDIIELNGQTYSILSFNNIGQSISNGFELFLMTSPTKKWDLRAGFEYNEDKATSASEFDQKGTEYAFNLWTQSTFRIRDDLKLDLSYWMWKKNLITGKIHPMEGTSLSLRKDFDKKSSIIFKVKDMFKTQAFNVTTNYLVPDATHLGGGNIHYLDRKGKSFRKYSLTFEYKFGEYKAKKFDRESSDQEYEGGMGY